MPHIIEALETRALLSTFTVTSLADDGSAGTLRWAVQQANADPGPDTINFVAGLSGTITLAASNGPLELSDKTGPTTIAGRVSIAPARLQLALVVDSGSAAVLSAISVAGVENDGSLSADGCEIQGAVDSNGGALYNTGTLAFTNGGLSGTVSLANGGAIYNAGGTIQIRNSSVMQAQSEYGSGGGIYSSGGSISVVDSTFAFDQAVSGAAIFTTGRLTIIQSTFLDSIAKANGGAIYSSGPLSVTNATISRNTASAGGGIYLDKSAGPVLATLYNTIVAINFGANRNYNEIVGTLDQQLPSNLPPSSCNLIDDSGTSGGLVDGTNRNIVGHEALLSDGRYYGGPMQTVVPLPGSPAIDSGNVALAVDTTTSPPTPLTLDQSGFNRLIDGSTDIGAVEHRSLVVNTTAPNEGLGQFNFTDAVSLADQIPGPSTITFDPAVFTPGVPHTITVGSPPSLGGPAGGGAISIEGPGANLLSIAYWGDVIGILPGRPVIVTGLTLTQPVGAKAGRTVAVDAGGDLTLKDCKISGNTFVGGIVNSGTLIIVDSTCSDNSSLEMGAGLFNLGAATVIDSTFTGDSAPNASGGAIYNQGTLTVINSTFSGNSAQSGGAIYITNQPPPSGKPLMPSAIVTHCTITGNSSGIDNTGTLVINNSIVGADTGTRSYDLANEVFYKATLTGSNNLIGTGGSGGLVNGVNGNIVGVADPKLAPLGNYGGPTQTMPPLVGSPAIDAGSNALAVDANGKPLLIDQRGDYRIINGTVDIGAVEYGSVPLLPGDANADRKVDFSDLVILARNYGMTHATWANGDFDGDGKVDFSDLVILARNYGKQASATSGANSALAPSLGAIDLLTGRARRK